MPQSKKVKNNKVILDEVEELLIVNMPSEFTPDSKVSKVLQRLLYDDGSMDDETLVESFYEYFASIIRSHSSSEMEPHIISNILSAIPKFLQEEHSDVLESLLIEIKGTYTESEKQSAGIE
jgi:hypothetical protein